MAHRLIDYDVLVADSASQLEKLIQEKINAGWEIHGKPRTKIERDSMTGQKKLIFWSEVAKYGSAAG